MTLESWTQDKITLVSSDTAPEAAEAGEMSVFSISKLKGPDLNPCDGEEEFGNRGFSA